MAQRRRSQEGLTLGDRTMVQGPCGFPGEQVRTIDDCDLNNVSRGGREVEGNYVITG